RVALRCYREALVAAKRASADFVPVVRKLLLQSLENLDGRVSASQARGDVGVGVDHHALGLEPAQNLLYRLGSVCNSVLRRLLVGLLDGREHNQPVLEPAFLSTVRERLRFFDCLLFGLVLELVSMY